jgi:Protein of unknown function (DUF3231)
MDTNEPLNVVKSSSSQEKLISTEMGKLWATYMGNTMSRCVLQYYLQHVEDKDIKKVVEDALNICESFIQTIKKIFKEENFPIPVGFNDTDVNLDAPRLFEDEFYLHYLRYTGKAGLSLYSAGTPLVIRSDIRDFFTNCITTTVTLLNEVDKVMLAKGELTKPPQIPVPDKVDFVNKQSYVKGFFGDVRPLHALEITHLYDNIDNDVTSKCLLIGFSQVAKDEDVRKFMVRGKEITNKHIKKCSQILNKDNLSAISLLDPLVSDSTVPPFSDKLMMFHKLDMFSMKIRAYANAISLNGRPDIGSIFAKFIIDIGLYVEDGASIMIDRGWMERPPEAADRDELSSPK